MRVMSKYYAYIRVEVRRSGVLGRMQLQRMFYKLYRIPFYTRQRLGFFSPWYTKFNLGNSSRRGFLRRNLL